MDRIGPFIPGLLIGAFALSLLVALFIVSPWWSLSPWSGLLKETSDRINLAQLVIETVGFSLALMAGIFAAWEFRRSQLRPSPLLFLYDCSKEAMTDSLTITKEDRIKDVLFDIRIQNKGRAVLRFLRVEIGFVGKPLFGPVKGAPLPKLYACPPGDYWYWEDIKEGTRWVFDGKDDYICHPGVLETLGRFQSFVFAEYQYSSSPYRVWYTIFAERMSPLGGIFEFHVIEPQE